MLPQLVNKVFGPTPKNADPLTVEDFLQEFLGTIGLQGAPLFWVDLDSHRSRTLFSPHRATLLGHNGAEQHAEVPVIDIKPQEQQRVLAPGTAHLGRNSVFVL